jgi:hypothetical protein
MWHAIILPEGRWKTRIARELIKILVRGATIRVWVAAIIIRMTERCWTF